MAVGLFFQERYFNSKAPAKAIQLGKYDNDEKTKMLALAIEIGGKVALGINNIGFPPTFPAREFVESVKLGMRPIQAGTKVNAKMLCKEDMGILESGKLPDITELQRVKFVMIGDKA